MCASTAEGAQACRKNSFKTQQRRGPRPNSLQEIDKAAFVCPRHYRAARAIRARSAARFPQIRLKIGENRAAVSVAVFSRFAIYATTVRRTSRIASSVERPRTITVQPAIRNPASVIIFEWTRLFWNYSASRVMSNTASLTSFGKHYSLPQNYS